MNHNQTDLNVLMDKKQELIDIMNIVLYNDDVNTFDNVIDALIKVCKHENEQAEQCAYIVHYTGKCIVKSGEYKKIRPMCEALLDRGLSATIE
jgi:ATP-dependent Clp protease adaptor protein ClpS